MVLVPPILEGEVRIARGQASQEVKEAWALYVAGLLGNVSPATAAFLEEALDPILAPALRRPVLDVLAAQVYEIQRERVSMKLMTPTPFPTGPLFRPTPFPTGRFPTEDTLDVEDLTGSGSALAIDGGLDSDAARRDAEMELWDAALPGLP